MRTDDELIACLKNGEEEAFEALYQRYAQTVFRHLIQLTKNREEAEDLLHETMLLMIKKIHFYTPNAELKNSFKAWLLRLSTNRAIDEIRKRKAPQGKALEEKGRDPFEVKQEEKVIGDLMDKLPAVQRMVLSLRVHEDLSYTEISVISGKDINSVKQALFQARKKMKKLLLANGEIL